MSDKKRKISLFRVISYGFRFNLRVFPVAFVALMFVSIFHGAIMGITTFVTQYFFDSVENVIVGEGTLNAAYLMIAALGITLISRELLNVIENFIYNYIDDKSRGVLARIIHAKMAKIAPSSLEDTNLLDDINRANEGAGTVFSIVIAFTRLFTFSAPYFIVMGLYLHHLRPQFIIALILVFVPVLAAQLVRTGIIAKFEDVVAPIRREHGFYHQSFTGRYYYKDTRVLGAAKYFAKEYLIRLRRMNKARIKVVWQESTLEIATGVLSAAGYAGILFMLVSALLDGEITVGAFAAVFGSIGTLFVMMQAIVQRTIGQMMARMGSANNFMRFLDLPEVDGEDATPDYSQGIIADRVSFKYPNATRASVDDVSLTINAGETVAIVGENGAGKSTLVRLLIGLYAPSEGNVTINGMDTQKTKPASIFAGISGVFQRYQRYWMTLRENVEISDNHSNTDVSIALEQANIDPNHESFPQGLDTMLSREFYTPGFHYGESLQGVDLSGGQWQRVAIARGLYRSHEVVVLDEPTAAIDPLEESRIYEQFMKISKDKTAIIVTHRLGSTKIADRVVVMDKGKIVEIGAHDELIAKNGLYAEMFKSQAWWYSED